MDTRSLHNAQKRYDLLSPEDFEIDDQAEDDFDGYGEEDDDSEDMP